MDAENNNDETNETSSQSQQGSEQTPSSTLRDLRPEKDPMGGGNSAVQEVRAQNSKGGVCAN
jgi:hypothetical protein